MDGYSSVPTTNGGLKLTWNEADGHYELRDHNEFLLAVAKSDIPRLIELLQETDQVLKPACSHAIDMFAPYCAEIACSNYRGKYI
jgi:hypothetical protein